MRTAAFALGMCGAFGGLAAGAVWCPRARGDCTRRPQGRPPPHAGRGSRRRKRTGRNRRASAASPSYPLPKTPDDAKPATPPAPPALATAATPTPADGGTGEIMWSNAPKGGASTAPAASSSHARDVELTVPLRDGKFYLGDIDAHISAADDVSVPKERLAQVLTPLLRPEVLEALKRLPASDGNVSLDALKAKGFDIVFDPAKVEMQFDPTIEQRATGKLSAGSNREQVMSENLAKPAIFAGYLNMRAGADYSTQDLYRDEGATDARVGFDGAMRWMDVVFESAATYDMLDGFSRGGSRFVYDMPDDALRFSAGDVRR